MDGLNREQESMQWTEVCSPVARWDVRPVLAGSVHLGLRGFLCLPLHALLFPVQAIHGYL